MSPVMMNVSFADAERMAVSSVLGCGGRGEWEAAGGRRCCTACAALLSAQPLPLHGTHQAVCKDGRQIAVKEARKVRGNERLNPRAVKSPGSGSRARARRRRERRGEKGRREQQERQE